VLIVVPFKVNEVPTIVWLTDEPRVWVTPVGVVSAPAIPVDENVDKNLTSAIVTAYPLASNVLVAPK